MMIAPGILSFPVADQPMAVIRSRLANVVGDEQGFRPSEVGRNRVDRGYRSSATLAIAGGRDPILALKVREILAEAVASYRTSHQFLSPLEPTGAHLLRYGVGDHYLHHSDAYVVQNPGRGLQIRHVTSILYVNDDYLGGEIEFPKFNIRIKPSGGTVLIFPANFVYEHVAHPVMTGTKYVIVDFFAAYMKPAKLSTSCGRLNSLGY